MPHNYLLLGHSFTKRLQFWCFQNDLPNMNIDRERIEIFWHGTGGATIANPLHRKSLWSDISLISDLQIDVTFIDIGSNDLCNYHIASETVAHQIITFAEAVLSKGCKVVVISEILPRSTPQGYNQRVETTNRQLSQACNSHPRLIFWSHSRNNFNKRFLSDFVGEDGVHIDTVRGLPRYYTSMRGALLLAERML